MTHIAVDWSGALRGARRKIWLAEARGGKLVRVECGRSREELAGHLIERAAAEPDLAVGLDFSFSFPEWFARDHGAEDVAAVWELAAREGERWLAACPLPFWGRRGARRPPADPGRSPFRRTEGEHLAVGGVRPKSVFQIGGAGAVGTGSVRGMPLLARLRAAGFAVWPFDPPRRPLAVEIYPRLLTGPVRKSSAVARALFLQRLAAGQDPGLVRAAGSCEDAFDAALSALAMDRAARFLEAPEGHGEEPFRLEGRIWCPPRPILEAGASPAAERR